MGLKKRQDKLLCAICLYTVMNKIAQPAIAVIGGISTCYDHLGYAQDSALSRIIILIKEQKANGTV